MEYIYAALLIHKTGKPVDEVTLKKVLEAAGITVDDARIKVVVASLEGVNIDDAIKNAAVTTPIAVPTTSESAPAKKEEKPKEDTKKAEAASAAGLSSLFG